MEYNPNIIRWKVPGLFWAFFGVSLALGVCLSSHWEMNRRERTQTLLSASLLLEALVPVAQVTLLTPAEDRGRAQHWQCESTAAEPRGSIAVRLPRKVPELEIISTISSLRQHDQNVKSFLHTEWQTLILSFMGVQTQERSIAGLQLLDREGSLVGVQ